ncbi:MAG: CoA pyrophosphatase [Sporolactobacillus sp.]
MDIKSIQRRIENDETIIGEELAKKSAVLLPLIKEGESWSLLLEVRAASLARQPGDVCFPGGRSEEVDATLEETAVRETCEELGVAKEAITVIGRMGTCIADREHFIYPFIGVLNQETSLALNSDEVAECFTIPVPWLLKQVPERRTLRFSVAQKQDFPFERIQSGSSYPFRNLTTTELFYTYHGHTIWGLTARMLEHFSFLMNHRMFA